MEMESLIQLINTVSSSNLSELEYEENGVKIGMKKEGGKVVFAEQPVVVKESAATEPSDEKAAPEGKIVKSPLVGTFYAAPSEDASPFASVGDTVKKGQTLAIVEAMKLMNEIESEFDGVVAEVFVENGQMVEYGAPLLRIQ